MKITGHTTTHVFRHYDIGDVDALRERLARAREQKRARPTTAVTPIRAPGVSSCTTATRQGGNGPFAEHRGLDI